jgi:hypothetical protein
MKFFTIMSDQHCFSRFIHVLAITSLLASAPASLLAQEASKEAPAATKNMTALPYDLEIKEGFAVWNAPKRKDNASGVKATLANVVDLLREQHPDANFVMSPPASRPGRTPPMMSTTSNLPSAVASPEVWGWFLEAEPHQKCAC